jgi:peptide-methionine (R)-S-oxide reductase
MKKVIVILIPAFIAVIACTSESSNSAQHTPQKMSTGNPYYSRQDTSKLQVANDEWKKILPPDLYGVARNKETERAFTGKFWDQDLKGTYYCAVCGNELFKSNSKFASSCGWPSFFESVRPNATIYVPDNTHGMRRTEVICGRCDSHLGHIFDDGPPPTGMRYCMNSISMDFEPDDSPASKK